MTELKRYLNFCKKDLPWMLVWIGFFWFLGVVMQSIFMVALFRADQAYASVGSIMAFVGLLVGMLTRSNLNSHTQFRLAIAMGSTRRAYLVWNTVLVFLEGLVGLAAALALTFLDDAVLTALLPTWTNAFPIADFFCSGWVLLASVGAVAAMTLLQIFLTALTNRFGMRAFFVVWLVTWGGSMVVTATIDAAETGTHTILDRLGTLIFRFGSAIGPLGWLCVGIAALLICAAVGVMMLRKAEIRF
jgi:hypothetical protein